MAEHATYVCPVCTKCYLSPAQSSRLWAEMDDAVAATPMPQEYSQVQVSSLLLLWVCWVGAGARGARRGKRKWGGDRGVDAEGLLKGGKQLGGQAAPLTIQSARHVCSIPCCRWTCCATIAAPEAPLPPSTQCSTPVHP